MTTRASEKSVRIFENDFMESLTHVHPIVPLLFWSPIAAFLFYRSVFVLDLSGAGIGWMAALALFAWTLTEYSAHRFLFHFDAKGKVGKYIVFLFHGVHHDAPQDKTRLVMPPVGAVLLMSLFYGLYSLLIPHPWIEPFFGFFIVFYLVYDYIHYATHHFPMRNRAARFLKRYHMDHHFRKHNRHYGVSSPLWDYVFGTR